MKRKQKQEIRDFSKLLGTRLRVLRNARGLTQPHMSELLIIDRSTYAYYETGKISIPVYYLNVLAKFYEISLDVLTGSDTAFEAFLSEREAEKD